MNKGVRRVIVHGVAKSEHDSVTCTFTFSFLASLSSSHHLIFPQASGPISEV